MQGKADIKALSPPLSAIALAMLVGTCLLQLQPAIGVTLWTSSELLVFLPISLAIFCFFPAQRLLSAFLLAYFWALLCATVYLQQRLPETFTGTDVLVKGVVEGLPLMQSGTARFNFNITQADRLPWLESRRVRVSWYRFEGQLQPGESWQLKLRLKTPHGMQNPAGFDYEKWLYMQGLHATAYVRKSPHNHRQSGASWSIDRMRLLLLELTTYLPEQTYIGFLQALTVGEKTRISQEQWQVLRNTGTNHLMAISGLHIGLIAGFVFVLVPFLLPAFLLKYFSSRQYAAILSLLVAGVYAAMAGFTVPTQRAFIMLLVFMLAILFKRPALSLNTLALALMAVVLFDPRAVLGAGFWLSFAAVLIIALVTCARYEPKRGKWLSLLQGMRIQWSIALAMFPLSLIIFQQGSLISPLANLFMIPLASLLIVPLALLAGLLGLISEPLGVYFFILCSDLLAVFWPWLERLSSMSGMSVKHPVVSVGYYLLALLGAIMLLLPRGIKIRFAGIFLVLPMWFYQPSRPATGELWVNVLDVGQGLAILLQTEHHSMLYDTGARFSPTFDLGERVVLPYLVSQGIDQLDMMLVSHADLDHAGGAEAILQALPVAKLLGEGFPLYARAQTCQSAQKWSWDSVTFEILHPDSSYLQHKQRNNRSCVLKISGENFAALLPGDIEYRVERHLLLTQAKKLQADLLLVPHHGSKTSSSIQWLKAVQPQLAIVSAGYRNRFSHPAQTVVERYQEQRIKLLNTAYEGAIQIQFSVNASNSPMRIISQRKASAHYWNHRF